MLNQPILISSTILTNGWTTIACQICLMHFCLVEPLLGLFLSYRHLDLFVECTSCLPTKTLEVLHSDILKEGLILPIMYHLMDLLCKSACILEEDGLDESWIGGVF